MKRTILGSALALSTAALALPAAAQVAMTPAIEAGHTLLSVSAEGRTSRKPDMAVFSAGVSSSGKTAGEAMAANSADMAKVIAALKRAGIADRDIQTSNLSLNPVYADMSRQPAADPLEQQVPRIIGYQANNQVMVKQRNLGQFGKVIDTLVNSGANQVNGPNFMIDEADAALDEARVAAVRKARQRAHLYAGAAGLRVVRILSISESGGYAPPMPVMYARASMDMAPPAPPPPVAAGEVSMQMNVTVMFELAP